MAETEPTTNLMNDSYRSHVLRYGLIGGLGLIIIPLIFELAGLTDPSTGEGNTLVLILSLLVMVVCMFLAVRQHKEEDLGGRITFGRALAVGFFTAFLMSVIGAIYFFIYISFINPDLIDLIKANAEAQFVDQGMSDEEIEQGLGIMEMWVNPMVMTVTSLLTNTVLGGVAALILGAVTQNDSKK